jgi:H+/gluconate symporter-like permease
MKERNIWTYLGYFGCIYLIILLFIVIGYPLAQRYALPVASFIFPINEGNSLLKTVLVMSGMYWGMVGFYMLLNRKRS